MIQQDGKIIIAGNVLVRFNTNGSIDSSFGLNGEASNFLPSSSAGIQSDEKVITLTSYYTPTIQLSRYKNDVPILSINNTSVAEGNSGTTTATFKVKLDNPSTQVIKVSYTTKDGTAKAGQDYVAASGTITFPAGVTTKRINVSIIADAVKERNEKFYVVLSSPVNAGIELKDSGICTITNDDLKPLLAFKQQKVNSHRLTSIRTL